MSQVSKGIFAVLAAAATLGAIQFASGSDLRGTVGGAGGKTPAAVEVTDSAATVNRAAKSDRAVIKTAISGGQTFSFRTDSVAGISVLLRLSAPSVKLQTATNGSAVSASKPVAGARSIVACEPVVSVLTEVSRYLQPGRCVT